MAFGPGKYDDAVTTLREILGARGILLVVVDGIHGSGFSAQLPPRETLTLPEILRHLADEIDQKGLTV
jgi:hypothetical protein